MGIIKKYKWYILPLAILVIVVAIVTTKPSKKTKEVKHKSTTVTPPQDTLKQAQEQYGYIPGYGGVPADSPEVAREQAENEARQRWHDGQIEWGIQQGYLNPDGSPKETN